MEYINYIGEDVYLHLHNYSDAEFLPVSCAENMELYNVLKTEKPVVHTLGE